MLFCVLAGQAHGQERVWSLDAAGEDAFLVYGVPESEDVGISFWCKIGADQKTLFLPVTWATLKDEEAVAIDVSLGTANFKLTGKATSGEAVPSSSIEADLPAGNGFFDALKATDRIKLTIGTHKSVYPLEDIDVDGLLKLCDEKLQAE
jgi:hypothetical protein